MKIKNLLLLAAAASLSMSAFAQQTGEYVEETNNYPTKDHFFVRGNYDDEVEGGMQYDNKISFMSGTPQLVWIHLDDDAIYEDPEIQGLTPAAYNSAGDLYNEITYTGFQFDIYMPRYVNIVTVDSETGLEYNEDEAEGTEVDKVGGDRLPTTSTVSWSKKDGQVKVIDGNEYDVYTFTCYNSKNGALKKDATLLGIYVQNRNQDLENDHRMDQDMILGNMLLTLRETEKAFFYGTGGAGVEPRFMQFNRVELWGSSAVVENLATKTVNNVKYFNVAGMESNVPFDGVNIKVTTYNDGTTSTCKVIK